MPPPSKKPPSPSQTPDIKRRVLILLDKLSDRDTFSQAATELELTARSLTPETNLTSFLSCLLSVDSTLNHKPAARAHSLHLISTLATLHGDYLSPHLPKILSSYISRRLRDPDSTVRSACVDAVSSLSRHSVTNSSPFRYILDPLTSAMLTEQDLNVQIGAAMCLTGAIENSSENKLDAGELRRVLPRMVKLLKTDGFKAKPAVWGLIGSVLAADGGTVVNGRVLMGTVVGCGLDSLASEDWAERKAAAEALQRLAVSVEARDLGTQVKRVCVESLEKRRFDKVKNAREAMNRALEAWREVPGEDSFLSRSNSDSSSTKDYTNGDAMSPPLSKTYNHAGGSLKTPSPQKKMTKSRSSLSDSSTITGSSPFTSKSCTTDYTSSSSSSTETPPQSKRILSKSRSSLSDDSKPPTTVLKTRSSLPIIRKQHKPSSSSGGGLVWNHPTAGPSRKQHLDWKIQIVVPHGGSYSPPAAEYTDSCVSEEANLDNHGPAHRNEEDNQGDGSVTSSDCIRTRVYDEREDESSNSTMFGSQEVAEYSREEEESDPEVVDIDGGVASEEEEYDNRGGEVDDLASIRKQLGLIEKQQSTLMNLLQNFMGRSQSGIDSLETRVSGLEKALDKITYGLTAVHSGRTLNEDSSGNNSCCMIPAAEFLSPKFWKKSEGGRVAVPKSMPNSDETADSWGGLLQHKLVNEVNHLPKSDIRDLGRNRGEVNSPRVVQACSGAAATAGSFGGDFSSTYFKPVVPRT